jgi:hypothetical protein
MDRLDRWIDGWVDQGGSAEEFVVSFAVAVAGSNNGGCHRSCCRSQILKPSNKIWGKCNLEGWKGTRQHWQTHAMVTTDYVVSLVVEKHNSYRSVLLLLQPVCSIQLAWHVPHSIAIHQSEVFSKVLMTRLHI